MIKRFFAGALCLCAVIALCRCAVRKSSSDDSVAVSGEAGIRCIIIDAGHGGLTNTTD